MSSIHAQKNDQPKSVPTILRWLRMSFRLQSLISNTWAARRAYRFWFMSPRYTVPARELDWVKSGRNIQMPHAHGPINLYIWGEGEETILLLHGWSGRGSQMGAFAEPLVAAGYRVIAMDAPGHGQTPGKATTLFKISEAVTDVAKTYSPIKAIVAHSFGGFVLAYSLKHAALTIDKAVCISTPARAEFLLDSFCNTLQLNDIVRNKFLAYFERDFGDDIWQRMNIDTNVSQLNVPALIIHDKDDKEVPYELSEGLAAAWPDAQLHLTEKLGHRRILRSDSVLNTVVNFIVDETQNKQHHTQEQEILV
ncbi:MAG: alpha/beta hydrolase [Gammaproteobacteria bacterium]|nr:alpha/beta hydrolase [Gammaproteobacteria bacterium]